MNDDFIPVKKTKKVSESDVEAAFVARVKELGGMALKFTSPSRRAVPDRIVLMPNNRAYFCELKAPGARPTAAQHREHVRLRDLGFTVDVIDNLNDAKNWSPR